MRSLLRVGELLQREGVADVVERLVAGEAFGLIHAGPVLLVASEDRVIPVLVTQHLGDVPAPAGFARGGMRYWIVSDLNRNELDDFGKLLAR